MLTKSKGFTDNINYIVTNSITLHNEIEDAKLGKGREFTSKFLTPGIAHYKQFGDLLVTKETIDKYLNTIIGCPVIINHKDITDKNVNEERVGVISDAYFNAEDGYYYCKGIIWDNDAISLVKNQGWNVSCSYDFSSDFETKTHNGKKIDVEVDKLNFLHLALVETPRYERANIVVNSKDKVNNSDERKDKVVMTALNELEKFVRNIVNNSCKEEKEEMKVENEDKRKLIDEIGGILKDKVDDEIIRTIIGKAEKLAYEKSEDGTADNKCKNAKEEEKEKKYKEEKEIAENEEIEVEEEELEEDAKNCGKKVKNSADTEEDLENTIAKARNIVYNGNSKAESSYITRADRLELGNNY